MITKEQLEELREWHDTWKELAENYYDELSLLREEYSTEAFYDAIDKAKYVLKLKLENERLTREYSKVNNSLHGSETSVTPNAWEHIEDLKQSNGEYWREIQELKEEVAKKDNFISCAKATNKKLIEERRELKEQLKFLDCLLEMGVDSWEGYDEANERFRGVR